MSSTRRIALVETNLALSDHLMKRTRRIQATRMPNQEKFATHISYQQGVVPAGSLSIGSSKIEEVRYWKC